MVLTAFLIRSSSHFVLRLSMKQHDLLNVLKLVWVVRYSMEEIKAGVIPMCLRELDIEHLLQINQ